jgi:perosamine synthetase
MSHPHIPLIKPWIDQDDLDAVNRVLLSGQLVQGPNVAEFERMFADYVGTKFAIAGPNCTEALYLVLLAKGITAGDKVAVTTYSWPTTANVIELVGATPIFIEIESQGFNMDPIHLQQAFEKHPDIKLVMPVHTFGGSCDIQSILEIASANGAKVLEDAACALGTSWNGVRAGAHGIAGCFSFHPRKAITTGEGSMTTTNDPELAEKLLRLRNHGQQKPANGGMWNEFVEPGHNYRMTDFQAALGVSQMKKLDRIIEQRRSLAKNYEKLFAGTEIQTPKDHAKGFHVYQSYVLLLPEKVRPNRDALITEIRSEGIEVTLGTYHMPLLHFYEAKYGFKKGDFPVSERVNDCTLTIPLYGGMPEGSQERIAETVIGKVERLR